MTFMKKLDRIDSIILRMQVAKLKRVQCVFMGDYSRSRCMHDAVAGTFFCKLHPDGKLS